MRGVMPCRNVQRSPPARAELLGHVAVGHQRPGRDEGRGPDPVELHVARDLDPAGARDDLADLGATGGQPRPLRGRRAEVAVLDQDRRAPLEVDDRPHPEALGVVEVVLAVLGDLDEAVDAPGDDPLALAARGLEGRVAGLAHGHGLEGRAGVGAVRAQPLGDALDVGEDAPDLCDDAVAAHGAVSAVTADARGAFSLSTSSASTMCITALMSARWVNACGKFPRWRPLWGSISSA